MMGLFRRPSGCPQATRSPDRPDADPNGDAGGAHPPDTPFGSRLEDLDWIDPFIANVRPWVKVRVEDNVLIKLPLEAYPLNAQGARMFAALLGGMTVRELARRSGAAKRPERLGQIHAFFCDVRDLLSGEMREGARRLATDVETFTESFTRYPVLSEFAITYRCNLACRFCYAGCGGGAAGPDLAEMSTADARRVIDIIAGPAKVPSVSFTGGEPTLRDDLPELIAHARERGLRVNLITNAIRCARGDLADRLADAGLTSAQVSVEGPDAAVHDGLTQRPGSFDATLAGLERLRAAGLRSVHTNTTLCAGNIDRAEEIVDLAARLGMERLSMNLVIPVGTADPESDRDIATPYGAVGERVLRIRDRAERLGVAFHWYSPTPLCVFNPVAHGLGAKGCAACDGLLHVSPIGDVLPCSSLIESVGNVLRQPFEAIWFGAAAQFYKRKQMAHPICQSCEDFALCQGACVLYWRRMGYNELLEARDQHGGEAL